MTNLLHPPKPQKETTVTPNPFLLSSDRLFVILTKRCQFRLQFTNQRSVWDRTFVAYFVMRINTARILKLISWLGMLDTGTKGKWAGNQLQIPRDRNKITKRNTDVAFEHQQLAHCTITLPCLCFPIGWFGGCQFAFQQSDNYTASSVMRECRRIHNQSVQNLERSDPGLSALVVCSLSHASVPQCDKEFRVGIFLIRISVYNETKSGRNLL